MLDIKAWTICIILEISVFKKSKSAHSSQVIGNCMSRGILRGGISCWSQLGGWFVSLKCRALQWCHNERDGVSNHWPHDCLLNCLFRRRSRKASKLHVTGLCEGNSPLTGEFPAQRASNAEKDSIWWPHHGQFPWKWQFHFHSLFLLFSGGVSWKQSKVGES